MINNTFLKTICFFTIQTGVGCVGGLKETNVNKVFLKCCLTQSSFFLTDL